MLMAFTIASCSKFWKITNYDDHRGFEMQTSYMQCIYLTQVLWFNGLGNCIACGFGNCITFLWSLKLEILQNLQYNTNAVSNLKLKYLNLMRLLCVGYQKCDLLEKGHFPVTSFRNWENTSFQTLPWNILQWFER